MVETGLVIPGKEAVISFVDIEAYLSFFEHVLVRSTASSHQKTIAAMYSDFVRAAHSPLDVPLLIPEFRYDGRLPKHKYRLDFCVIDADTMDKVGFEFSPWSTHGLLTGTKGKTQQQINDEAQANFEQEMKKHKSFFKKHGVFVLIYTDYDLAKPDAVFADIKTYLEPRKAAELSTHRAVFHLRAVRL